MALRLNRINLQINTKDGMYGLDIPFKKGLNIIRAGNSSGKSTCIQAIIYALGIEAMLTAKHQVPLPHVAKQYLETNDQQNLPVLESRVWLEIQNKDGDFLTITRGIVGEEDNNLISACIGRFITNPEECTPFKDYYVRVSGAAQNERGFHKFLSEFIGIKPPQVMRFDGNHSPLYIECIFPLFLVEQKRGWSGIQATVPTHYGIKDVRKKAIEYVLNLDCSEIEAKKEFIKKQKDELKKTWELYLSKLQGVVAFVGGSFPQIPQTPVTKWDERFESFFYQ